MRDRDWVRKWLEGHVGQTVWVNGVRGMLSVDEELTQDSSVPIFRLDQQRTMSITGPGSVSATPAQSFWFEAADALIVGEQTEETKEVEEAARKLLEEQLRRAMLAQGVLPGATSQGGGPFSLPPVR